MTVTTKEMRCVVCGLAGHDHKACKETCAECGLNYCEGARKVDKKSCVVTRETFPERVLNAIGRDLPDYLKEKLEAAWDKKHPNNGLATAAVTTGAEPRRGLTV